MYSMTVDYPRTEGSHFDLEYYRCTHIPLCEELLSGQGYLGHLLRVDPGKAPGSADLLWASVVLLFESAEFMNAAFKESGAQINGDVPNFTSITPDVSFAETSFSLV